MKKFSKLFWVALVVVAVLACTAIGIFAADTTGTTNAVVYGDFVDLSQEGDSFEVGFHFKENDTLVECGKITLTWDSNKMTANSIVAADALNGAQFGSKIENGKAVIAWAGSDIKESDKTGKLFTVTFTKVSADVTDALIDVTVDDFGYTTETFKPVDMADTVKVNNAFAGDGTATMTYAEGKENYGDPVAFLNAALERAETGEGQTVNVELGADMVFDAYTAIGDANGNHVGKVVITSAPISAEESTPAYGIKLQNSPAVVMYGNYEFSNMLLETISRTDDDRDDNALVFPDDSSAVFGEGLTKASSALALNIAGNVEVNSGTYCYIAGNCKGSGVKIAKELNITVQGNTVTSYVAGGMIESKTKSTQATGQINAKSNVKILGNAKVSGNVYAGGRYTSAVGTAGADVLINTTNKIGGVYALCGSLNEASTFNIRIINGTITRIASALVYGGGTVGTAVVRDENGDVTTAGTEINWYIDGGTVTTFNGGLYTSYTASYKNQAGETVSVAKDAADADHKLATNNAAIKGEINIYVNKQEEISGIEYGTPATITNFYGGSDMCVYNSSDAVNRKIEIHEGTSIGAFVGGSKLWRVGTKHTGSTEITIYGMNLTGSGHIYGGSYIDSAESVHLGDCTTTYNGVDNFSTDAKNFVLTSADTRIIGGSLLNNPTATHTGKTTVNFENVVLTNTKPATVFGGSYCDKDGAEQTGESCINVKLTKASFTSRLTADIYGGSMLAKNCIHSGDSKVYLTRETGTKLIVGASNTNIYGGSYVQGSKAYHTGDSEVETGSANSINYLDSRASVYGGSRIMGTVTEKPAKIGEPGDETYPNSKVTLKHTLQLRIYGGSRVETASTVYSNSSVIIEGLGFTNASIAGGSHFLADNGKQVGNSSFTHNGSQSLGRNQHTVASLGLLYVTGGISTDKANIIHEGNATLTLNSSYLDKSTPVKYGSLNRYDVIAAGGYNVSKLDGNSEFNMTQGTIKMWYGSAIGNFAADATMTGETQRITTAGIYGTGTMEGDITANIKGGYYYYASNASFYIGSYGTNVLEAPEDSTYDRGFRHVGDITCNFSGGTVDDNIQLAGKNNDIEGNVYYNQYGTAKAGFVNMRNTLYPTLNGSTPENYAYVVTGDVVSKISGGTLIYGIVIGGPYSSTAVIEGNNFMEISGGTLNRTDNSSKFALGLGATTNGKAVIKFVGNDFTLDPVETGLAEGKVSGMNIYSAAGNTATLDLWHYTGERDLTAEASNFDKVIYPFNEGSVVTMSTKTWENGTVLSDFVKGQTLTVDGHEYAYDDIVEFDDDYTDYNNAFDFYASQLGGIKVDTVNSITKIKVAVNTGDLVEKSAEISGFTNDSRNPAIHGYFDLSSAFSLSLSDSIAINLIGNKKLLDDFTDVKAVVTFSDENTTTETIVEPVVKGDKVVFSFRGVSPRRAIDKAYYIIMATTKDTQKVGCSAVLSYSIKDYCDYQLGNSNDAKLKTVCMDLLNYCAANQEYFEYKVETLVNDVSESYKAFATATDPVVADNTNIKQLSTNTIKSKAPGLTLKDSIQINFTFEPRNPSEDMSTVVAKLIFDDGRTKEIPGSEFINMNNGQYRVPVADFTPSQMRNQVTIALYRGETQLTHIISYGISDYIGSGLVDPTFQDKPKLLEVLKTMIKYGDAVKAYVG